MSPRDLNAPDRATVKQIVEEKMGSPRVIKFPTDKKHNNLSAYK